MGAVSGMSHIRSAGLARQARYSGWAWRRLWRVHAARIVSVAAIGLIVLATGGCAMSYKLGSLFGDKEDEKPEYTSSTTARPTNVPAPAPSAGNVPADADLGMTRAAAAEALARGGTAPAIVSAANEVAVAAFVEGNIRFGEIPVCIETALERVGRSNLSLEAVREADRSARDVARAFVVDRTARPSRST